MFAESCVFLFAERACFECFVIECCVDVKADDEAYLVPVKWVD